MSDRTITSRVLRPEDPRQDAVDRDWMQLTPGERMEAVWTLTKTCYAWGRDDSADDEPRLQRSVSRVQRPRG